MPSYRLRCLTPQSLYTDMIILHVKVKVICKAWNEVLFARWVLGSILVNILTDGEFTVCTFLAGRHLDMCTKGNPMICLHLKT